MKRNENRLKERMSSLSTRELRRIIRKDSHEYTKEAVALANEELRRREIHNEIQETENKSAYALSEDRKEKVPKIIQIIMSVLSIVAFISFELFYGRPTLYWSPQKGEYGTKRLHQYEIITKEPLKIYEFIGLLALVSIIYIISRAVVKKVKKDWLK